MGCGADDRSCGCQGCAPICGNDFAPDPAFTQEILEVGSFLSWQCSVSEACRAGGGFWSHAHVYDALSRWIPTRVSTEKVADVMKEALRQNLTGELLDERTGISDMTVRVDQAVQLPGVVLGRWSEVE